MPRKRSPWVRVLVAQASLFYAGICAKAPLPLVRICSLALGRIAYYTVPRIRRVGLANLDLAYGDSLSSREKRRILRGSVDNSALVAAEFSHTARLFKCNFEGCVRVEGREHVDQEKGALCIGSHMGNWEWTAPVMAAEGFSIAEVVRPLDDAHLNALVDGIRRIGGVETIPKDDAGRQIIQHLKGGGYVGVLIDQSPRRNGVPVDFFGARCWATIAPAMIAARTKLPIHPVAMIRQASGQYVLRFYPALELVHGKRLRDDLVVNTQRCQDAIEAIVRAYPEQWLWFHRRWKSRDYLENEWREKFGNKVEEADEAPPKT
jgi:Kdo2-lipid IVA lauroyltransferase/acyltransferase